MVSAVPNTPENKVSVRGSEAKIATPEIILLDNSSLPIEVLTDLIFEDIGGQEIINIARHDTINGQNLIYQAIKNLEKLSAADKSNRESTFENNASSYFKNFSIKIDEKIPDVGNGPDGSYLYLDEVTGNLVVEAINLSPDEQIEIQIIRDATVLDGTIYLG
jgi:hypothetical protein